MSHPFQCKLEAAARRTRTSSCLGFLIKIPSKKTFAVNRSSSDDLLCEEHLTKVISFMGVKCLKEASDLVLWYSGKCRNFDHFF